MTQPAPRPPALRRARLALPSLVLPGLALLGLACGSALPAQAQPGMAPAEAPAGRPGEGLAPSPSQSPAPGGGTPLRKDAPAPSPAPAPAPPAPPSPGGQAARPAPPALPPNDADIDKAAAVATAAQRGIEAARALERLHPEAGSAPPSLADPQAAPLLRRLFDSEAVVALRPVGQVSGPALAAWSEAGQKVLARYAAQLRDPATRGAAALALQEEITLATVFVFRISATLFAPAMARAAANPAQGDAVLARLSRASAQSIGGMLTILSDRGLEVENARPIAAALAADVPLLRPALSTEARLPLVARTAALMVQLQDEAVRSDLRRLQEQLREGG
ncbi:hypothetical protein [Pseudoroseomonas cervicalis]|uniref:hypothetical protein n=1 Tax=Teichococcus cervicalis TaxID=204525 RepID=UPI0027843B9E|nr:hypothetical protein [Pseudoroseomonas cervicalis]MDQ1080196.1 hypothetical protein [Pseudoroseomonas cervicalis]